MGNVTKHPLYNRWIGMKMRCYNESSPAYQNYGGRGILVCQRWVYDFPAFAEDMGPCPHGHSLDRIDNSLGYSPENCRWADRKTQNRNTRRVRRLSSGELVVDLAEVAGVDSNLVTTRLLRGVPESEAFKKGRLHSMVASNNAAAAQRAKTHCPLNHEYTVENTKVNKKGQRSCKKCMALRMREVRAKKKLTAHSPAGVRLEP